MMQFIAAVSLLESAAGHGSLVIPPSRAGGRALLAGKCRAVETPNDLWFEDGRCRWFNQGCQPGCEECTHTYDKNPCVTPMEPTVTDVRARTWLYPNMSSDWTKYMPWRSPGFAPVSSPCGVAGGGSTSRDFNGAHAPAGTSQAMDGRLLPELENVKTVWPRGSVQDVAFDIEANHGGGYAYRLCPKDHELTEECFQRHHLQFASDQSWIQYGEDEKGRIPIPAYRITEGTNPPGSQWTVNPIPACADASGGEGCEQVLTDMPPGCDDHPNNATAGYMCLGPMYEPPLPGVYGYGYTEEEKSNWILNPDRAPGKLQGTKPHQQQKFDFAVVDKVFIPEDLPAGEYVISWRWDMEQFAQIWANCADVTITAGSDEPVVV